MLFAFPLLELYQVIVNKKLCKKFICKNLKDFPRYMQNAETFLKLHVVKQVTTIVSHKIPLDGTNRNKPKEHCSHLELDLSCPYTEVLFKCVHE